MSTNNNKFRRRIEIVDNSTEASIEDDRLLEYQDELDSIISKCESIYYSCCNYGCDYFIDSGICCLSDCNPFIKEEPEILNLFSKIDNKFLK